MDQQTLLTIFVAVAAVALFMQLVTLIAMFLTFRRLETMITGLLPEVQKIIGASRRTAENVEGHVNKIGVISTAILEVAKQQTEKIDELLNDARTRAKVQMERAEMVLDDTMGRAQETVSIVQRSVLRPIREVQGVSDWSKNESGIPESEWETDGRPRYFG